MEARVQAAKPARKWRRMLMTQDELIKIQHDGEKACEDEAAFQDGAFDSLMKMHHGGSKDN